MRAKSVNEIKQDKDTGLSAIGVGKTQMNEAYKNVSLLSPNIKSKTELGLTDPDIIWASLLSIRELIPDILGSNPANIIRVSSRSISDEAKNYLHSKIFNDGSQLSKKTINLVWKSTDENVKAAIYTNYSKGATIVEYTTPEGKDVVYFFFRTK